MLLLDEPTNHLDIEAIDSLAEAIKAFKVRQGGPAGGGRVARAQPARQRPAAASSQACACMLLASAKKTRSTLANLTPTCRHAAQGGMVLVSHDFRLIDQVANDIWVW
jgi:ABC-type glutathione transport system ATPase component